MPSGWILRGLATVSRSRSSCSTDSGRLGGPPRGWAADSCTRPGGQAPVSQARGGAGCRCWPPPRSRSAGSAAPTVTAGDATATLQAELFQRDQVGLAVGGVLGDLVQEGANGDPGADRQGGLVDPFAGQRSDGPRPDQDAAVAVGEQPDGGARPRMLAAATPPWDLAPRGHRATPVTSPPAPTARPARPRAAT